MDYKEATEIQMALCRQLLDYYQSKGYNLYKKEWDFVHENIVIPFFLMSTRGPYVTIRPSIINKKASLLNQINKIVNTPILNNGVFIAGSLLNSSLLVEDLNLPDQDKVVEIAQMYYCRIFDLRDLDWVVRWHIAYMEEVGWKLIELLKDDETTYSFYKKVFTTWTKDDCDLDIFERSYELDMGAHATMIYLGLRDQHEDVSRLIELTRKHLPNSLYLIRSEELEAHFLSQT